MALGDVFKTRAKGDFSALDEGNIQSTGIGLRQGEIDALSAIGADLQQVFDSQAPISRNSIMRIAVRQFLEAYLDGRVTAADLSVWFEKPEKPQPKLKL